ncbi:MAG: hypothetical protein E7601_04505 [Ruminococcaceae bacterium]|nr:hypothetical protein [Oscillospiraceae bacterium]
MNEKHMARILISAGLLISVCISAFSAALTGFSAAADSAHTENTASYQIQGGNFMCGNIATEDYKELTKISAVSANLMDEAPEGRSEEIKTFFREYAPDIAGLQEITQTHMEIISELSGEGGMSYSYATLTLDGQTTHNPVPIIYNSQKFELSPEDTASGAYEFESTLPAVSAGALSWAILTVRDTGRKILVMNTCFAERVNDGTYSDEDAVKIQKSNALHILKELDKIYGEHGHLPTLFTGDFNMQEHEESHRILLGKLDDLLTCAKTSAKYLSTENSNYKELISVENEGYPTDRIYISKNDWIAEKYETVRKEYSLRMSDHYPIYATLYLRDVSSPKASLSPSEYKGNGEITLICENRSGAKILYTLDSSDPKENGTVYSSPISVSGNITLKAVTEYSGSYSDTLTLHYQSPENPPLILTKAIKNTDGRDIFEGFELINVSDHEIDLADFRVFYLSSSTEEGSVATAVSPSSPNMLLSSDKGKYVLKPGQIAYVCIIFTDHYTEYKNGGYKIVAADNELNVIYDTESIRRAYAEISGEQIPSDVLIVPLDRTSASFFRNGKVTDLKNSFNLENAKYARLFITYDSIADPSNYITSIYMPKTTKAGTYVYTPAPDGNSVYYEFTEGEYSIGKYRKEDHELLKSIMQTVPENFDEKLIGGNGEYDTTSSTTVTDTIAHVTTSIPQVSTSPSVTSSPTTTATKPLVTTSPAPSTTSPSVTSTPTTTATKPLVTTSPAPSTTSPSVTSAPTTTATKPLVTTSPAPSTTSPSVTSTPTTTTTKPLVTTAPAPSTTSPSVTSTPTTTKETTSPGTSKTPDETTKDSKTSSASTTKVPPKRTTSKVTTKAPAKETTAGTHKETTAKIETTTTPIDRDTSINTELSSPEETTAVRLPERNVPIIETVIISVTTFVILACVISGVILIVRENKNDKDF